MTRTLIPLLLGLTLLGCPGPAKTAKTAKTGAAKTAKTVAAKTTKTVAAKTDAPAKTPDVAAKLPQATYFAFKG